MAHVKTEVRPSSLGERYREVRARTELLAAPLSPEDQMVQSMADASPTKWHRGHTTWFFEAFVLPKERPGSAVFDPDFGYLFNSYYEAVGPRQPRDRRGVISRPSCAEIADYRAHLDKVMEDLLDSALPEETTALVELGINHEQQHQELLLMDIKHALFSNPLCPEYLPAEDPPLAVSNRLGWSVHDGGRVAIGHRGDGFAFDNETPPHSAILDPFALADRLVTCGEWLEFVDDGGYRRPELWLSEGWATVGQQGWEAPLYWTRLGGEWWVFTLMGRRLINESEPVCHVSYYEADAFARWRGFRLPTEAEWEVIASAFAPDGAPLRLHPLPGDRGLGDLFGQVWQWTSSAYGPYPGFRPAAGAVGEYNGKFMVNQQVLRGGACVTPEGHTRATYRNFFPPASRWAFSGVRLARDL
jgi:ergothioneine biosynthesis protein EgtB